MTAPRPASAKMEGSGIFWLLIFAAAAEREDIQERIVRPELQADRVGVILRRGRQTASLIPARRTRFSKMQSQSLVLTLEHQGTAQTAKRSHYRVSLPCFFVNRL